MESTHTSQKSLDELLQKLLDHYIYRLNIKMRLKNSPDWIADNYNKQCSDKKLLCFVRRANNSYTLKSILTYVIDNLSEDSITYDVFSELLNFKDSTIRERIIISLSHKHLQYDMLKDLCETNICFECYFELVCLVYCSNLFDVDSFVMAMQLFMSSPYSEMLPELIQELSVIRTTQEEKATMLRRFS